MTTLKKTIKIFDSKIGRDSPDRIKWALEDFSKIHYGEIEINLGAADPIPIPLTSWKLTKIPLCYI